MVSTSARDHSLAMNHVRSSMEFRHSPLSWTVHNRIPSHSLASIRVYHSQRGDRFELFADVGFALDVFEDLVLMIFKGERERAPAREGALVFFALA